jgi:hypothetical protein
MSESGRPPIVAKSAHEDHPFQVQIAFSAYGAITICTVTVGGTRVDDCVEVTNRSDDRPLLTSQQAKGEALPTNRDEALSNLLDKLSALWMRYWTSSRSADYHPESFSHVLTAFLVGNDPSLSVALTREGRTIAHGIVVYHAGAFCIVESTCVSISFETRPLDPILAEASDLLLFLERPPGSDSQ